MYVELSKSRYFTFLAWALKTIVVDMTTKKLTIKPKGSLSFEVSFSNN